MTSFNSAPGTPPVPSDAQIHDGVLRELRWEARVDETEVGVRVEEGVVTLRGGVAVGVGGRAKKLAAEDAAGRVAGVRRVANALRVEAPDGLTGPGAAGGTDTGARTEGAEE